MNGVGLLAVPVTTLDSLIAQYGEPDFCKIDVEGFEQEVLKGLSSPLGTFVVRIPCRVPRRGLCLSGASAGAW